jgi:hypothetical protein
MAAKLSTRKVTAGQAGTARRLVMLARSYVPMYFVLLVAFYGSFGNIMILVNSQGVHGWRARAAAAVYDAVCMVCVDERRRDRAAERTHRGWFSMPVTVLLGAISLTLAANLATAPPNAWGYIIHGTEPTCVLLIVLMLERRSTPVPAPAAAVPDAPDGSGRTGSGTGSGSGSGTGSGSGSGPKRPGKVTAPAEPWLPAPFERHAVESLPVLLGRIRRGMAEYAEHNDGRAMSGERVGKWLGCSKKEALGYLAQIREEDRAGKAVGQ